MRSSGMLSIQPQLSYQGVDGRVRSIIGKRDNITNIHAVDSNAVFTKLPVLADPFDQLMLLHETMDTLGNTMEAKDRDSTPRRYCSDGSSLSSTSSICRSSGKLSFLENILE